jgi:SAM-dependent methyltransferase
MPTYKEVFDDRGLFYNSAMALCPMARDAEFKKLVQLADIKPSWKVVDVPSGGGYLHSYINVDPVMLINIEFSAAFRGGAKANSVNIFCDTLDSVPLQGTSDCVLSLAGLHHFEDHAAMFKSINTLLKPEGTFVLADVEVGSLPSRFLNSYVDQHSLNGHKGLFLGSETVKQLESAGFSIESDDTHFVPWRFPSRACMLNFCRLIFGLEEVNDTKLEEDIAHRLGMRVDGGIYYLAWDLRFIKASKS